MKDAILKKLAEVDAAIPQVSAQLQIAERNVGEAREVLAQFKGRKAALEELLAEGESA